MNLKQHAKDSHTDYSIPSLDRILQKVLEMNRAIEYEKPVLMAMEPWMSAKVPAIPITASRVKMILIAKPDNVVLTSCLYAQKYKPKTGSDKNSPKIKNSRKTPMVPNTKLKLKILSKMTRTSGPIARVASQCFTGYGIVFSMVEM